MTGASYQAPLRCEDCSAIIEKKPRAKTPKYCPPCRHKQQEPYRAKAKKSRQLR